MRFHVRLISALAPVCLLTAWSAAPRAAEAQNPSQVHPITSLPLPPDETSGTPAVTTPVTPAPAAAKPAAKRRAGTKATKKIAPPPAVEPVPAAEPVAPAPTPTVEPPPAAIAPATKRRGRKERSPKPSVVAAPTPVSAAEGNTVHPIRLPPPPDEEPATSTPEPAAPTPKPTPPAPKPAFHAPKTETPKIEMPKAETPKPTPKTRPAPETTSTPMPVAVKPVPVVKPVINPDIKPAPVEAKPAPAPKTEAPKTEAPKLEAPKPSVAAPTTAPRPEAAKPETPKTEAPKPAPHKASSLEPTAPTNRLPIAPVAVPTTAPAGASVAAPKTVVVPSSVVVEEPPPAPVSVPKAKPAKPQPTLKSRGTGSPVIVTMPSSNVGKPSATPAPPVAAPAAAPAPPPPPPGTLAHIVFQGAEPYTQAELAPLTGLALGTHPSDESLQTASNRLIGTGLFSNVRASYDTPNDLGVATFILEPFPPSQLARVSFANFVWLTPAEIEDTVKALPLYRGVIPMSGNVMMADSIQAALQSALATRGVQATLTHMLIPPSPQHPYTAMEFRVTSPNVVLASASLFDIPRALVNRTLKAQVDATKVPYNEGIAGTTLSDILLAPAQSAGYIGAKLWHIERKRHVVNRSTTSVDFVARMDAGPVYTVHSLRWTPTPVLSEAEFHRLAALHVGQVTTTAAADKTQQAITEAYYAQGYLEASISAMQTLDPKTGTADYTYSAVPGPQYRLGSISVHGLSPDALKDFNEAWTMKLGDVYNDGYLLNFLTAHQNIASLKGYTFTYDRSMSADTHNVDLTLTFNK